MWSSLFYMLFEMCHKSNRDSNDDVLSVHLCYVMSRGDFDLTMCRCFWLMAVLRVSLLLLLMEHHIVRAITLPSVPPAPLSFPLSIFHPPLFQLLSIMLLLHRVSRHLSAVYIKMLKEAFVPCSVWNGGRNAWGIRMCRLAGDAYSQNLEWRFVRE